VIVPQQALTKRGNQDGIFIVSDDHQRVRWCPVKIGVREDEKVQVESEGLERGLVVTLGQQLVDDGSSILIAEEKDVSAGGGEADK
jgi:multidrug efflux pump subunit AcrA (membrane-fusion protein)